ncbi:hypothetical protein [Stakelama marina]|uniref:Uncharacterized protein n=1 Tax=Stakelama marina TaxID=2826939 RepID=A0A8T4IDS3_9SPHN|nr:hypothetical protein [Stakelama marina]MBR0552673.1 hypothetical protein [Stakelama marina]
MSRSALALVLGVAVAATPALAQHRPGGKQGKRPAAESAPAPQPMPEDPLAPMTIFNAICHGGGMRFSADQASAVKIEQVAPDALRALAETLGASGRNIAPVTAEQAPNPIYSIENGATYLFAPTAKPVAGAPVADSCLVAWRGGDDDYLSARRVLFPNSTDIDQPLTARPSAHFNGAMSASTQNDVETLNLAAYNGWIVLRSTPLAKKPATPETPGAQ